MGTSDARARLASLDPRELFTRGMPSAAYVQAIRRCELNIERLAAAAWHQQQAIEAIEQALAEYRGDALPEVLPQKVRRVTDMRLRASNEPCVECDAHWREPVKNGRMPARCPSCR